MTTELEETHHVDGFVFQLRLADGVLAVQRDGSVPIEHLQEGAVVSRGSCDDAGERM